MSILTADQRELVALLISQGLTHRQIADRTGLSLGTISNVRNNLGRGKPPAEVTSPDRVSETGDVRDVSTLVNSPIKTLDQAVAACGVDLTVWIVSRWECTTWTTPLKLRTADGKDEATQQQQYRVSVKLARIMPKAVEDATAAIFDRMAAHAPEYRKPAYRPDSREPCMAVYGLFDAHFGKLCWGRETGDNYDLGIAEEVYANAVEDLIRETSGRDARLICLPIGSDFFHMDNSRNTTFNNTPQDVDGRYAKIIETGEMAVISAAERLAAHAPVKVVWIPGNHDPTTSYHLARTIKAWFHRHPGVTVDCEPATRKYVRYGTTLIGLTHGNEERKEALPGLMANEQKEDFAATTCHEWLTGHLHSSKAWVTKPVETQDAMVIRTLRSLAGTDAWHARRGYLNLSKAAEVYWYGRERGYIGHAVAYARTGEK